MRQIFLDTETTGFYHDKDDRVVEIACVEMIDRRLTGRHFHVYLNPRRDMPEAAFAVHGLSAQFLSDKPLFEAVAAEFLAYVAGAEVIAHNAKFDADFLSMELARVGRAPLATHVERITDSLAMAKEIFPGKRNSLDALCDRLGVDNSGRTLHGALLDAELLADVYINLTRGQEALLMDSDDTTADIGGQAIVVDLRSFDLPVLLASDAEAEAHLDVLKQLDKASGGKTLWPKAPELMA